MSTSYDIVLLGTRCDVIHGTEYKFVRTSTACASTCYWVNIGFRAVLLESRFGNARGKRSGKR